MNNDIVDQLIAAAARHSGGVDGELPNLLEMAACRIRTLRGELRFARQVIQEYRSRDAHTEYAPRETETQP